MLDPILASLPFVNRNQLDFEAGTVFDVELVVNDTSTDDFKVSVLTKQSPLTFSFTGDGNGTDYSVVFALPDMPISVAIQEVNGYTDRDSTYIVGYLRLNGTRLIKLFNGQQFAKTPLSWPLTQSYDRQADLGHFASSGGTSPATGAEISTVANGKSMRVRAIYFQLVTSATVATRQVNLKLSRLANTYAFWGAIANGTQTAGLTRKYVFAPFHNGAPATFNNHIFGEIPNDLIMRSTDVMQTVTTLIDSGDAFTDVVFIGETLGKE